MTMARQALLVAAGIVLFAGGFIALAGWAAAAILAGGVLIALVLIGAFD